MDLFNNLEESPNDGPLANQMRPVTFEGFFGQDKIFKIHPYLKGSNLPSLILSGPPGSGKTTLAQVLANFHELPLLSFNAVLGGVGELRDLISKAKENQSFYKKRSIIFVDEIHRFNKAQQDALLPHVEKGDFILIGATTENPKTSVNRALLSRVRVVTLYKHTKESVKQIIEQALKAREATLNSDLVEYLSMISDGDARYVLNSLEVILDQPQEPSLDEVKVLLGGGNRLYDKSDDRHYDVISAFIKSLRGSDPDAALMYLAIMIEGGEDPKFIARRLIIFASEDVGNADPQALTMAVSALQAVESIGMPEARINLSQITCYLASTVKSNACYKAIDYALEYVRSRPTIEVPTHLRNHHPDKNNYLYPHNNPEGFVYQKYFSGKREKFYEPKDIGTEAKIKARLQGLWKE